jgi:hypothetical protein
MEESVTIRGAGCAAAFEEEARATSISPKLTIFLQLPSSIRVGRNTFVGRGSCHELSLLPSFKQIGKFSLV